MNTTDTTDTAPEPTSWERARAAHTAAHPDHAVKSDPTLSGHWWCGRYGQPAGVRGCGRYIM